MRRPAGFTLVELLVVISIVAMLVALLIRGAGHPKHARRRSVRITSIRSAWPTSASTPSTPLEGCKQARGPARSGRWRKTTRRSTSAPKV